MPLSKLNFNPGINKEETAYSNEGGWVDGDKIRFRKGRVEKSVAGKDYPLIQSLVLLEHCMHGPL